MIKFSASASVFTEEIKGKDIFDLLSGNDQEMVSRLVGLIEDELGELPLQELHCPPATVRAFLEAVLSYLEKENETEAASRMKNLIPLVARYYEGGEVFDFVSS